MPTTLRIRLLGDLLITRGDDVVVLPSARAQALLALLLLRRGIPQPRQRLAFLLWPDTPEAQARTNLRTLLHRLRAALPEAESLLSSNGQMTWWAASGEFSLDIADFEAALADAAAARDGDPPGELAALERAASLYQGDLLPGCYDDWAAAERERLRDAARAALGRLADVLEARGDYARATSCIHNLLRADPLDEAASLRLMRLGTAAGDRAGALRAYHTCAAALRRELDAEPGPELRAAYAQLVAASPAEAPPPPLPDTPALIGRRQELAAARAAWRLAAAGRPQLVAMVGEAGIGKTRVAEELLAEAGRAGAATATARCYAAEGDLPFAPLAAWLGEESLRRRCARLDAERLSEVSRLAPDLLALNPGAPHPGPLTERWQRTRLFEALARAALTGERPLILLLDDAQWCDRETLAWLHYLLRAERQARLMVLLTVRQEEAPEGGPLDELLASARRDGRLTEVVVPPLSRHETAELAGHTLRRAVRLDEAERLFAETEGNPLFVVESLRAGLLAAQPGAERELGAAALPPGVRAVIARRLMQVSPPAREILGVAAVIGRSFTLDVLARTAEVDEDVLVYGLDELWRRRVVRHSGPDSYDFSHEKLRAAAYAALSPARRRLIHRRAAEVLETGDPSASGQVASHYERAGMPERAALFIERAAEAAQRVYANDEALGHYRRALALLDGRDRPAAARLYARIGDLLHHAGQRDEARHAWRLALAETDERDGPALAALHRKIGNAYRDQHRYDEARRAYGGAQASLGDLPGGEASAWWQEWAELRLEEITFHYFRNETAAMFALIDEVQPILARHGTPVQRARLYQNLALGTYRSTMAVTDETVGYARAYLAAVHEAGADAWLPSARFQLGFMLLWHWDLGEAEAELRAALALAERSGDISLTARSLTYLAIVARHRGDVAAVRDLAMRSLAVTEAAGMLEYLGAAHGQLAWLAWLDGDVATARAEGAAALACWEQRQIMFPAKWLARWPLLALDLADGTIDAALAHARGMVEPHQNRPAPEVGARLEDALSAAAAGDTVAAGAALAAALAAARGRGYL